MYVLSHSRHRYFSAIEQGTPKSQPSEGSTLLESSLLKYHCLRTAAVTGTSPTQLGFIPGGNQYCARVA